MMVLLSSTWKPKWFSNILSLVVFALLLNLNYVLAQTDDDGPRQYSPSSEATSLNNVARIGGVNRLDVSQDAINGLQSQDGDLYDYLIGIVVPAVVMIFMFVFLGCSMCFAKQCCDGMCGEKPALIAFVAFGVASSVAWFVAIGGNATISNGLNSFVLAGEDIVTLVNDVETTSQSISATVTDLAADLNGLTSGSCSFSTATEAATGVSITTELSQVSDGLTEISSVFIDNIDDLLGPLQEVQESLRELLDSSEESLSWREWVVYVLVVFCLVTTSVFIGSTAIRLFGKVPPSMKTLMRILSKITSSYIFYIGIILMFLIIIVCAVLSIFSFILADTCVPDINSNLNRIFYSVSDSSSYEAFISGGGDDSELCDDQGFKDVGGEALCFLQECPDTGFVDDALDQGRDGVQLMSDGLTDISDALSNPPTPPPTAAQAELDDCAEEITDFNEKFTANLKTVFESVEELLDCGIINEFYAKIFYDGVCGDTLSGLIITWGSIVFAVFSLMVSMFLFRIQDMKARLEEDYDDEDEPKVAPQSVTGVSPNKPGYEP